MLKMLTSKRSNTIVNLLMGGEAKIMILHLHKEVSLYIFVVSLCSCFISGDHGWKNESLYTSKFSLYKNIETGIKNFREISLFGKR